MESFDFEKLRVYQMALEFIDKAYLVTKRFPKEETFGLSDQLRRASVSVALNIAEGSGGSKTEFRHFLKIARRSVRECIAVAEVSYRQRYEPVSKSTGPKRPSPPRRRGSTLLPVKHGFPPARE